MRIRTSRALLVASVTAATTLSFTGPVLAHGEDSYQGGDTTRGQGADRNDRHRDDGDQGDGHQGDGETIEVHPGASIQAAVDAAVAGSTVVVHAGTYEESVTITTDDVSLVGYDAVIRPAGAEPTKCDTFGEGEPAEGGDTTPEAQGTTPEAQGTTSEDQGTTPEAQGTTSEDRGTTYEDQGATPEGGESEGVEGARISGICVFGEVEFPAAPTDPVKVLDAVEDVSITGITVEGASGDGLIALGTRDLTVRHGVFRDNGGYGAASFVTEGTTFEDNESEDNAEAGFYVGDSPESDADVRGNHSSGNELGFFFRNASEGEARYNVAEGNCVGMLVLAGAPGAATGWQLQDNKVEGNDKVCPGNAEDGVPPLSGAGIALVGAQEFEVEDNWVARNASTAPSAIEGGIIVISSGAVPGLAPFEPSGEVEDNRLRNNEPADIVWDESGEVEFDDNRCATSDPEGLCA